MPQQNQISANGLDAGNALVARLEAEIDVNALTFRGIRLWPRLRSLLIFAYTEQILNSNVALPSHHGAGVAVRKLARDLPKRASAAAAAVARIEELAGERRRQPLMFMGTKPRLTTVNGADWSLLFDPLAALVAAKSRFAKLGISPRNRGAADIVEQDPSGMIRLDIDPLEKFLKVLDPVNDLTAMPAADNRRIANIEKLHAQLPEGLAAQFSEAAIVNDAINIESKALVLRIILEYWKPPVVFFTGQKALNLALTLSARQLGIPTVDVQHGAAAFSPANIKWHSWLQIPDDGYELLPDYFWVWGEAAAELVNRHANPRCPYHRAIVGGHPALIADIPDVLSPVYRERRHATALSVLVTLGLARANGLPSHLIKAMANAPADWLWLLRVHPQDWGDRQAHEQVRARLEAAGVTNFEMEETTAAPLHQVLPEVDRHVTPSSSTVVEASAFGVPTLFIDPLARSLHAHLINTPGIGYAETAHEIVSWLSAPGVKPRNVIQVDRKATRKLLLKLIRGQPVS